MKKSHRLCTIKTVLLVTLIFCFFLNGKKAVSQTNSGNNEENQEATTQKYKVKKKVFRNNNVFSIFPLQAISNYMTVGYEFKTGEKTAFKTIAGYSEAEQNLLSF